MPNWNATLKELGNYDKGPHDLLRAKYLNKIQEHTPGGDVAATESIVSYLQSDPQVAGMPAQGLLEEFELAA